MRAAIAATAAVALAIILAPGAGAELLSKSYNLEPDVTLELAAQTGDGLRVDSVRFEFPASRGGKLLRTRGLARAEVAVSNVGSAQRKLGVAIALFDAERRLLGVASAGTSLMPLKPGRQRNYTLVFDHVNSEARRATTFQITLESKP